MTKIAMLRKLQIANIISLAVTIAVNYLSNTGIFNGNTMKTVSDQYQNLFTPAGYAFSVWGLIYLGLTCFVIYQSKGLFRSVPPHAVVGKIGWMFVLSCLFNCIWVVAWLYNYTGLSVLIMIGLLTSLGAIVLRTRMEIEHRTLRQIAFEWWPFAIYLGWISVALLANISAYLTKIGWSGFGVSDQGWAIVMICVAVLINVLFTWKRNLRESAVTAAWGLAAVAVANRGENETVFFAAIFAAAVLLISIALHFYRRQGDYFLSR